MSSVNFILFIVIFTFIKVETLGSTDRIKFNLTANELIQKCYQKGPNLFTRITSTLESLRNIQEDIIEKYIEGTNGAPLYDTATSIILMSKLCETNSDIIKILRKLTEDVQLCLDDEDHLNDKEMLNVLRNMMLSICLSLDFEKIMRSNKNCLQDPRRIPAEDKCVTPFINFKTIYELDPIPLQHTAEECEEFSTVWNCEINASNGCEVSVKNSILEFVSIYKEFILC